ncbi:MAG TPA: DUF4174 domain-containing protein [Thermomicrobiales bacterium]|jgi:hypothetical protein
MAEVNGYGVDLAAHRWQHRLILVFASTTADPAYVEQLAVFAGHKLGNADRDLLIGRFPERGTGQLNGQELAPDAMATLRRQLTVEEGRFTVLLIGKDGGVKLRSDRPLTAAQIFATIDQMPMRQQERRSRG